MRLLIVSVVLLLMQLLHWVGARGLVWLLGGSRMEKTARHWLTAVVFITGNSLLLLSLLRIWRPLFRLSAGWMVLMLYVLFAAAAVWLLQRLLRRRVPAQMLSRGLRVFAPLAVLGLFALSLYNAYTPVVRHYRVEIDKPLDKPLRIGMASDLHLGILFGAKQLDDLAQIMQREKVDLILLPGDIMDDDTVAYDAQNMRPHFAKLRAPLGVYATLGNHDLFGAQRAITRAIREAGITVLNDEAHNVDGRFTVVGRPDELDGSRAETADLLRKRAVDTAKPVILLDHRPSQVERHAQLPIDIQVSGHVHNGQVFPANFIVKAINRVPYGYAKINKGHFFVTSGYGFWGVPFRLGSQSEVMVIDVVGRRP